MKKLLVATNNPSKLKELSEHLSSYQLLKPEDFDPHEPEENGLTYQENAFIKARFWYRATGLATLADDSGLNIVALDNWPGVHTAELVKEFGTYSESKNHIWEKLQKHSDHSAFFISFLAYIDENGREHMFEGRLNGKFVFPARGIGGFAYDDVFQPEGYHQTLAELGSAWKKKNSHRTLAIKSFVSTIQPRMC